MHACMHVPPFSMVIHSVQVILLITLMLAEIVVSQHVVTLLRGDEANEPLLPVKDKKEKKGGGKPYSRLKMASLA